jgi:hypothetical protein
MNHHLVTVNIAGGCDFLGFGQSFLFLFLPPAFSYEIPRTGRSHRTVAAVFAIQNDHCYFLALFHS